MDQKTLILIIIVLILAAGIGAYFVFQKPQEQQRPLKLTSPVYFYIEFHTEAIIRSQKEFEIETELLKRLANILEKHNARGSFMLLDIYPKMVKKYQPEGDNFIMELERQGHEIGIHYHPPSFELFGKKPPSITLAETIEAIKNSGAKNVTSLTTSFHIKPVMPTESVEEFDEQRKRAEVNQMIDEMYSSEITSAFRWCMEDTTPYRPQRDNWITYDITKCQNERPIHDPKGKIIAVGQYEDAGYAFPEGNEDPFVEIIGRLGRVLSRVNNEGVNYFPLAIHDYYFLQPSGKMPFNLIIEINEDRLKEFDMFLSKIDEYVRRGALIYATRMDVTNAYLDSEKRLLSPLSGLKQEDARLNIFYLVHVHSSGDIRPEFSPISEAEFNGTVNAISAITRTLESHGAKGIFHFLQNFSDAVLKYQGDKDNILNELERQGHEVGAHAHTDLFDQWKKTRDSILAAGIKGLYSLSGVKAASIPIPDAFKRAAELGFKVLTGNNSPLDPFPIEGMSGVYDWGLGGNEVYKETGAFVHPWRPDYENEKISEHNPKGQILYIDHVPPIIWWGGSKSMASDDFARLRPYFDAAIENIDKDQINTWGFVTHEVEYQVNGFEFKPTNPVNEESIKALDDFLKYVDEHKDRIRWVTTKDIYKEF